MRFELIIHAGNAAVTNPDDLSLLVHQVASKVAAGHGSGVVLDAKGTNVGAFSIDTEL